MPITISGDLPDIFAGRRWPSDGTVWFTVTYSGGAPAGVDGWDWQLNISRSKRGGTPLLALEALSVAESSDVLTIGFVATAEDTEAFATEGRHWAALVSRAGTDNEAEREALPVNVAFAVGESS